MFMQFMVYWMAGLLAMEMPTGTGTIRGEMIDKTTGDRLLGGTILLKQGSTMVQGVSTDLDGRFELQAEEGTYQIEGHYVGYAAWKQADVSIKAGEVLQLRIELEGNDTELDEIIISQKISRSALKTQEKSKSKPSVTGKKSQMSLPTVTPPHRSKSEGPILPPKVDRDTVIENAPMLTKDQPFSTFSIDVDKASYTLVRQAIMQHGQKIIGSDQVRIEEMINYFHYNYEQPKGEHPMAVHTELSDCPWNKSARLLLVGMKGKETTFEQTTATNLVFLVDVSGSMQQEMPLLKQSLGMLVEQMREKDRISVVVYAGAAGVALPSTSGADKKKILDALAGLEAGGSTAGGEGILLAYKTAEANKIVGGNNRVVLVTDGDFNVGVSSNGDLEALITKEREKEIFLTVLGMGGANYRDQEMETLADKGNGNYYYIDNLLEARRVLTEDMCGTLYTIAKDVKLQLEFNPEIVRSYRLVGYENRILAKEDFDNDAKDAGELGSGHTVTALYELVMETDKKQAERLMTLRFRYKKPQGKESILQEEEIKPMYKPWSEVSDNLGWAATVAGWGQLLRKSVYAGDMTAAEVLDLSKRYIGRDKHGERAEFRRIVEQWNK